MEKVCGKCVWTTTDSRHEGTLLVGKNRPTQI